VLNLIPVASLFFTCKLKVADISQEELTIPGSTAVGAALWAADIEKATGEVKDAGKDAVVTF
jgi:hypothetical protein